MILSEWLAELVGELVLYGEVMVTDEEMYIYRHFRNWLDLNRILVRLIGEPLYMRYDMKECAAVISREG